MKKVLVSTRVWVEDRPKAEELSKKHRMLGVSVISKVGVRNYYRKFGYTLLKMIYGEKFYKLQALL